MRSKGGGFGLSAVSDHLIRIEPECLDTHQGTKIVRRHGEKEISREAVIGGCFLGVFEVLALFRPANENEHQQQGNQTAADAKKGGIRTGKGHIGQ